MQITQDVLQKYGKKEDEAEADGTTAADGTFADGTTFIGAAGTQNSNSGGLMDLSSRQHEEAKGDHANDLDDDDDHFDYMNRSNMSNKLNRTPNSARRLNRSRNDIDVN